MPITAAQARELTYKPFKLTDADFSAGRDDDTSLSAGTVGEVATAEIGEDGQLSNYLAVQLGQPATQQFADVQGNEIYVKLQAASADVADSVDWAFAVRDKGELGGGVAGNITGFRTHRGQDNSDPRQRNKMRPQSPVARDGKILSLLVKDETQAVTVDLSESDFEIPALGGQD